MSFNVTTISPSFNATGVYLDSVVTATFNENVQATSVTTLTFSLVESDTNVAVDGTVLVTANKTIRFTPAANLKGNTRYTAVLMGHAYGVLSAGEESLPETVSWNFTTGLFVDSADAVDEVPAGVDPEAEPTGDEIYLVTSNPDNSAVNVLADSVVLTFTGLIPSGTSAEIVAAHPLGYPAGDNYWVDNQKLIVDGSTLTISSSGDIAESLASSVEFVTNEALITADSILISESGAATNGVIPVRFGIDANFQYVVKVHVPTNTFVPRIDFVSKLLPQVLTVEELRLFSGSVLNRFNDFTLATLLYKTSLTAKGLWESHGHTWPSTPPYYAKQYVLHRALRDMMTIVLRDSSTAGGASQRFGELALGANVESKALIDDLRNLDLTVTLLGQKLTAGNTSAEPLIGPAWAIEGKSGGIAILGSQTTDAAGRDAPMYRTGWSRALKEKTRTRR